MNKLIDFGSDGASNMTGQKRGMVTQMKNDNPEMIGIGIQGCYKRRNKFLTADNIAVQRKLLRKSFKVLYACKAHTYNMYLEDTVNTYF